MTRFSKALSGLMLAAVLAACGGGGGSPGATPNQGSTPTPTTPTPDTPSPGNPATPVASSMIFELSKPELFNAGGDATVLTVTALDANNNPMSGVPLTVSVDSGVYTPADATTGNDGKAGGSITVGANKANRNITATIKMGSLTATAVVAVTGSQIAIVPVPATPQPGQPVRVDIKVTDKNGGAVPNVDLTMSGTLGVSGTAKTDLNGTATVNLGAAPATANTYTIDVSGLGVQASRSVQVVSATGGGVADAVGTISSASVAVVPNTISPNTSASSNSRAALRAKFVNASNQAIQNVRVRFQIEPPALGSGEEISTADATVYSDVNGEAIADYIAGTRSSPTDGVKIRACFGRTDAELATELAANCPNAVHGTLTVASQPLSITLGDNNLLERGTNSLTYIKKFDVAVADAAGNAVANAVVSASVDISQYRKAPVFTDLGVFCANEDTNRNGFVDVGEDANANGKIEPRKADVILSFLASNATASNGRMQIQVEYPQNVATWLRYTVRVTTNVAGSEGTDAKSFITSFIEGDEKNGSFITPPYGAGACSSPN